jgi:Na+/H+-dicarboxylate symporter
MDDQARRHVIPGRRKPWYRILYLQVLIAILIGALLGWLAPQIATNDWVKALGDGFITLIRMMIAPVIFCTVVSWWEGELDRTKLEAALWRQVVPSDVATAVTTS